MIKSERSHLKHHRCYPHRFFKEAQKHAFGLFVPSRITKTEPEFTLKCKSFFESKNISPYETTQTLGHFGLHITGWCADILYQNTQQQCTHAFTLVTTSTVLGQEIGGVASTILRPAFL